MANLGKVIYLTEQQYTTLYTNGTLTVGNVTITYSADDLYLIPDAGGSSGGVTSVNGYTGAVTGLEETTNKVTSLSANSTDTQYPSAKCVYDLLGNLNTILTTLNSGNGV